MSGEDIALIAPSENTKKYVKTEHSVEGFSLQSSEEDVHLKSGIFHRVQSIFSIPSMTKFRRRLQKMNCFKTEEEEIAMIEMPRHKSIDIGTGFARRMSLFLFTKRSVCVHPYHPFTPKQTTRKIYKPNDD
ncbi:uncharacterized protein LOC123868824 [Maniola jurtina]|uniref:uncharacterized protein LOC123868824 n=1 Tax=Maniola jurtina TaxID=191418 RepID=UPI001E68F1AD|nr:uncharacterized protein LOC123868824 [Maniola jurtina]